MTTIGSRKGSRCSTDSSVRFAPYLVALPGILLVVFLLRDRLTSDYASITSTSHLHVQVKKSASLHNSDSTQSAVRRDAIIVKTSSKDGMLQGNINMKKVSNKKQVLHVTKEYAANNQAVAADDGADKNVQANMNQPIFLHLRGEPKSGTTWLEVVTYEIGRQLCGSLERCEMVRNEKERTMDIQLSTASVSQRAHFDAIVGKHEIPGLLNSPEAGCSAYHDNSFAKSFPCGAIFRYGSLPSLDALVNCSRACISSSNKDDQQNVYLHISRDPRDTAVSSCFQIGFGDTIKKLEQCVKFIMYPKIAVWSKFRELWFFHSSDELKLNTVHVSYEAMIHCPLREYTKLAQVIIPQSTPHSDEKIRYIIANTTADVLRGGKAYDMHDLGPGNFKKIREAGKKNYRSYNISPEIIKWMDGVFEVLSFQTFHPNVTGAACF